MRLALRVIALSSVHSNKIHLILTCVLELALMAWRPQLDLSEWYFA